MIVTQRIKINRRDFIKITAITGGVLAGGKFLLDLLGEDHVIVKETRVMMGTIINLAVVAESQSAGEGAVAATLAEMERQIAIFNHRNPESPVNHLNAVGRLDDPPTELVEVLTQAAAISEMSDGAFDVTVMPLVSLYQKANEAQAGLPDEDEIQKARALVGFRNMDVSPGKLAFTQPGMSITLDGIAKGYIVDAGVEQLKSLGYESVFVEAGGDLMAAGSKEPDTPWRVGVRSPRQEQGGMIARFNVRNQAVATSGDYMQYYSPDLMNHHIIDPRTGHSPTELASATIVSGSAVSSDALATAVMVMGVGESLALVESLPGIEVFLVSKHMEPYASSGFQG
jgi:thiamine biosynthesis lipoprotein